MVMKFYGYGRQTVFYLSCKFDRNGSLSPADPLPSLILTIHIKHAIKKFATTVTAGFDIFYYFIAFMKNNNENFIDNNFPVLIFPA